jgi:hypothetical protein
VKGICSNQVVPPVIGFTMTLQISTLASGAIGGTMGLGRFSFTSMEAYI